jgi:PAS domain S-box-containing protein
MTGYKKDKQIGYQATLLLDKENQKILSKQWPARLKGAASPYEITLTRKDNTTVHTLVSPSPLYDEDGQFSGTFGVFTEITDRKQAEEKLFLIKKLRSLAQGIRSRSDSGDVLD